MSFRRMMLFALGGSLVNTIIQNLKNFISIITLKNGVTFEGELCSVSGLTSLQDSNILESANFILLPNNSTEYKIIPSLPIPTDDVRNLLFRSEGGVTSWTNNSVTSAVFTGTTDPLGGLKVVRVIEVANTSSHTFSQAIQNFIAQVGARFSYSVYLKKGGLASAPDILQLSYASASVNYNVNSGIVTSSGTTANFTVGGSIENAGSGWWRCIMTGTTTGFGNNPIVYVGFTNNNPTATLRPSYLGATTRDLYLYGAQFETSLSATTYQRNEVVARLPSQYISYVSPTFGTYRVTSSGNLQNTPYENIIYPSINISTQPNGSTWRWLRNSLGDSITGFNDPNGNYGATRLGQGGSVGSPSLINTYFTTYQTSGNNTALPSFPTSKIRTLILYVKQDSVDRYLGIRLQNGGNVALYTDNTVTIKIDCSNGTLVNNPSAYVISYTSQFVGDGWYKICINRADGWDSILFQTSSILATMSNSSGVLIWNVQILDGVYDINTPTYPREIGYSIPRLDYSDSNCPEYLIERSMYNSLLNSENFTAATWTTSTMTVTTNTETAPNLELAADTLTATGSSASIRQSGTANSSVITPRIFSVYMKRKTGTGNVSIDMGATSTNVSLTTTGWTRAFVVDATLSGTYTASAGNYTITTSTPHSFLTGYAVYIDFTTGTGLDASISSITVTSPTTFTFTNGTVTSSGNCTIYSNTGKINIDTNGDEVYVWGAQIESSNSFTTTSGRIPSSYITTTTTQVSRVPDTIITNFSGSSSCSLFFEMSKIGGSGNVSLNFLYLGNETSAGLSTDGLGLCGVVNGGISYSKKQNNGANTVVLNPLAYSPTENTNFKLLFTTSGSTVNLWMDGALVSSTSFVNPNNLKYITLDANGGNSYVKLNKIYSWPITLNRENIDDLFSYPFYNAGYTPVNYELQHIINRAYAEGFTIPNTTILGYCDTLITEMKNDDVWGVTDLFSNFAYNDISLSGFSRINWKNPNSKPSGIATLFGGLIYQNNGFKGDGSSGYVDTLMNLSPLTTIPYNYTLNNAGRMLVVSEDASLTTMHYDGVATVNRNNIVRNNSVQTRINSGANGLATTFNMVGIGLKSIMRDSSTNVRVQNTSTKLSTTQTSSLVENTNQLILRSGSVYADACISNYYLGASLTTTQIDNFRVYYNTFLTNIGLTPFA